MVDINKRQSLKTLATAATVATVPVIPFAASASADTHSDVTSVVDHLRTCLKVQGIGIQVIPTPEHPTMWVRLFNKCGRNVTLDHVGPGLIRSGGNVYDVNSVLGGKSLTLAPNEEYAWMIEPATSRLQADRNNPL